MSKFREILQLPSPDALNPDGQHESCRTRDTAALFAEVVFITDRKSLVQSVQKIVARLALQRSPTLSSTFVPEHFKYTQTEYDAYFAIQRTADEPIAALLESAMISYHRVIKDSLRGSTLGPVEEGQLFAAIQSLIEFLIGSEGHSATENRSQNLP